MAVLEERATPAGGGAGRQSDLAVRGAARWKHHGTHKVGAGQDPSSPPAISVLPPESFQSVCRQTCLNTMTCVFFHLLPPPLCSPHPVGSAASPPGHLPAQFAELLLSRSLMTPCGQVQWAFLGPHLPCPLSGV